MDLSKYRVLRLREEFDEEKIRMRDLRDIAWMFAPHIVLEEVGAETERRYVIARVQEDGSITQPIRERNRVYTKREAFESAALKNFFSLRIRDMPKAVESMIKVLRHAAAETAKTDEVEAARGEGLARRLEDAGKNLPILAALCSTADKDETLDIDDFD